jgi:HAE1 family hydrophobic/amphiphilic exporter-1
MFLSDLSIRQPVFATMIVVTLVVLGVFSWMELQIDLLPNIDMPVVSIRTVYPGVAPETMETEVTRKIEEAVNPISGVKHIQSTTTEGLSNIVIQFHLGTDLTRAQQDVQSKINGVRNQFPRDVEEPVIQQLDFSALPIVSVAVTSPVRDRKALTTMAEKIIKRRFENVAGVGAVLLVGPARREVQLLLEREKLKSYGLTFPQVFAALERENLDVPAGKLDRGPRESLVRVAGKMRTVAEFNDLVIASPGGVPIYLRQLGRAVDGIEEERSYSLVDGRPALALDIQKQSGSNTVEVADGVKATIARVAAELPPDVQLRIVRDNSKFIRDSVEDVQITMVIGALLTVMIVFIFLASWRSTVITGLTLPVSVISAFIVMKALGFTLNILTLMGLSLAIGLLIDDAIVVRENIVRHMQQGEDHLRAASVGTSEIGLAVMATTFSIIAVFGPVAFMGGIVGRFFYQFGITVAFAVAVSLFVSFTLDPMLSSRWYDPDVENGHKGRLGRALAVANYQVVRVRRLLEHVLPWALRHRYTVMALGLASVVLAIGLFGRLGSSFMTEADRGDMQISFKADPGTSLKESIEIARRLDEIARRHPAVVYTYATIGAGGAQPINEGQVYVKLKPRNERAAGSTALMQEMRYRVAGIRGLRLTVESAEQMGQGQPIQVSLRGTDLAGLDLHGARLAGVARKTPGMVDVGTSIEKGKPETRIRLDRQAAADLGLDLGGIASTVRGLVAGEVAGKFEDPDGDSYDVRVRLAEEQRRQDIDLALLDLQGGRGGLVPLSQVARIDPASGPSNIRRYDLMREVRLTANTSGRSLGEVINDFKKQAAAMGLPPGYSIVYSGQTEDMAESFYYIYRSLVLAVVFIYAILASQFRSFFHPLAIMLSLPLSLIGVAVLLALAGDTLNIMSMIGLIMLMGLVTKNAILMVDFTNVLRRQGEARATALVKAAGIRLRPILMTTLAMIFGMLPLAFEIGSGSEFRAPMARAVIGGLITSTVLTLVVVPVAYTFLDDLAARMRAWWGVPRTAAAAESGD